MDELSLLLCKVNFSIWLLDCMKHNLINYIISFICYHSFYSLYSFPISCPHFPFQILYNFSPFYSKIPPLKRYTLASLPICIWAHCSEALPIFTIQTLDHQRILFLPNSMVNSNCQLYLNNKKYLIVFIFIITSIQTTIISYLDYYKILSTVLVLTPHFPLPPSDCLLCQTIARGIPWKGKMHYYFTFSFFMF